MELDDILNEFEANYVVCIFIHIIYYLKHIYFHDFSFKLV